MKRTCGTCAKCVQEEYGYSSWTILGVEWKCPYNPDFPMEDATDKAVMYGATCENYVEGDPTIISFPDDGYY